MDLYEKRKTSIPQDNQETEVELLINLLQPFSDYYCFSIELSQSCLTRTYISSSTGF